MPHINKLLNIFGIILPIGKRFNTPIAMKKSLIAFAFLTLLAAACKSAQPAPDHDKVDKAYQEYKKTETM